MNVLKQWLLTGAAYAAFGLACAFMVSASGCTLTPTHDSSFADPTSVSINGYTGLAGREAKALASPTGTGSWTTVAGPEESSDDGPTVGGITGYYFSFNGVDISDEMAVCTRTDGDGVVFIKTQQELTSGFTDSYATISDFFTCWLDEERGDENWNDYLNECGFGEDDHVIEVDLPGACICEAGTPIDCSAEPVRTLPRQQTEDAVWSCIDPAVSASRFVCWDELCLVGTTNLSDKSGDPLVCPTNHIEVGPNPGDLCDGGDEILCTPLNLP